MVDLGKKCQKILISQRSDVILGMHLVVSIFKAIKRLWPLGFTGVQLALHSLHVRNALIASILFLPPYENTGN